MSDEHLLRGLSPTSQPRGKVYVEIHVELKEVSSLHNNCHSLDTNET